MTITIAVIEARKAELAKEYNSLEEKINTAEKAIGNMKKNLSAILGAVQQCDFFINAEKKDDKKK